MTSKYLKKNHLESNIIFYNLFFYCKSKFTWHICVSRDSIQHMSKKSVFHHKIWPKTVTHLHGITLITLCHTSSVHQDISYCFFIELLASGNTCVCLTLHFVKLGSRAILNVEKDLHTIPNLGLFVLCFKRKKVHNGLLQKQDVLNA